MQVNSPKKNSKQYEVLKQPLYQIGKLKPNRSKLKNEDLEKDRQRYNNLPELEQKTHVNQMGFQEMILELETPTF